MQNRYAFKNIRFYNRGISPLLKEVINILKYGSKGKRITLLDLGTGDGVIIHSLLRQHIINTTDRILGIDITEERCLNADRNIRDAYFIAGDVLELPIQEGSIDLISGWSLSMLPMTN